MSDFLLVAVAVAASTASVVTVAADRFRNVAGGLLILAANIFVWLPLADGTGALVMMSLIGSPPLFVAASIF